VEEVSRGVAWRGWVLGVKGVNPAHAPQDRENAPWRGRGQVEGLVEVHPHWLEGRAPGARRAAVPAPVWAVGGY
jgi:hypothetical protein